MRCKGELQIEYLRKLLKMIQVQQAYFPLKISPLLGMVIQWQVLQKLLCSKETALRMKTAVKDAKAERKTGSEYHENKPSPHQMSIVHSRILYSMKEGESTCPAMLTPLLLSAVRSAHSPNPQPLCVLRIRPTSPTPAGSPFLCFPF